MTAADAENLRRPSMPPIPVLVLQHYKENLRKCSLTGLRGRAGIEFRTVRPGSPPEVFRIDGGILLAPAAPVLEPVDRALFERSPGARLVVLDGNWAKIPSMLQRFLQANAAGAATGEAAAGDIAGRLAIRSLPRAVETAYPRQSKLFEDPAGGLASIEALAAALHILGRPDRTLLDGYRWKDEFLERNRALFGAIS